MKNIQAFILIAIVLFSFSCNQTVKKPENSHVKIKTEFGDIVIKLYDEAPLHRDNFLKLAGEGYFDDQLFHRVIEGFMVQGGDPDSKNAEPGKRLGNGGPGYTIPAEFDSTLFHKKGVLAAARQGDQVNPEKRSSGSQFYIVQGEVYDEAKFEKVILKMNNYRTKPIFQKHYQNAQEELNKLQKEGKHAELEEKMIAIREAAEAEVAQLPAIEISEEKRAVYSTIGGTPHLDNNYTVFGEVVEGLAFIDSIAAVKTDEYDRPIVDVKMKIEVLD